MSKEIKFYNRIKNKNVLIILITIFIIFIISYRACVDSMKSLQYELISDRLNVDIQYLYDDIGKGDWKVDENGFLYKGEKCLGDGTYFSADITPFTRFEEKTGTFCYSFKIDNSRRLKRIKGGENEIDYDEGHYLRVAGSTLGPNGNSIVGTYMSKEVSDILDVRGYYEGEANVAGGMIYCVYKAIYDSDKNIIGAIVVGRGVGDLERDIRMKANILLLILATVFIVYILIQIFLINQVVKNIYLSINYLERIRKGELPNEDLHFTSKDEFSKLSRCINGMTDKLRETERLRHEAETDHLTGILNRLGLQRITIEYFPKGKGTAAISMIDIDYFKEYNDNYGHQAGDQCIKSVSGIIRDVTNDYDNIYCARYGGDEFIIVYCNVDKKTILTVANEIKKRIHDAAIKHEFSNVSDIVTLSHGIYFGEVDDNLCFLKFMHKADEALYQVKKKSRDDFILSSSVNG